MSLMAVSRSPEDFGCGNLCNEDGKHGEMVTAGQWMIDRGCMIQPVCIKCASLENALAWPMSLEAWSTPTSRFYRVWKNYTFICSDSNSTMICLQSDYQKCHKNSDFSFGTHKTSRHIMETITFCISSIRRKPSLAMRHDSGWGRAVSETGQWMSHGGWWGQVVMKLSQWVRHSTVVTETGRWMRHGSVCHCRIAATNAVSEASHWLQLGSVWWMLDRHTVAASEAYQRFGHGRECGLYFSVTYMMWCMVS